MRVGQDHGEGQPRPEDEPWHAPVLRSSDGWRALFDAIGHPTMILDPERHIMAANRATLAAGGRTEDEMIGMCCHEIFHGTDVPPPNCPMNDLLSSQFLEAREMELEALDSMFLVSCTPLFDEDGKLARIIHLATDVGDKAQYAERVRTLVEQASDLIALADETGRFLEVNSAGCEMLGYTREDLLGMTITDVVDPEDLALRSVDWDAMRSGETLVTERRYRRKDGSVFPVEISTRKLPDGRIQGIGRDISERKRAEDRLARALMATVEVVNQVVEARDPYTAGHQRRAAELAVRLAVEIGMDSDQVEQIRIAGLMHDVGKMIVPAEILSKPGKLSRAEFELVKGHAEAGHQILANSGMEDATAEIVRQHHERCDGSGYPRGLMADELLPQSKVLMVADVVEAMCSHRPYRPAPGMELALAEIEQGKGRLYDSDIAAACIRLFRDKRFEFTSS